MTKNIFYKINYPDVRIDETTPLIHDLNIGDMPELPFLHRTWTDDL